jgi:uracil-DNA glycosylase family 4
MTVSIPENMRELEERVLVCNSCRLRGGCTQVVFGEGYPGLMVIGEGPGAEEDRLGRPFVGTAGQLLDKILAAGGFDRNRNAFIANIVKCRPPGNRIPQPDECTACLPYLREQMNLLQPKVVLLLGATAFKNILQVKEGITKCRGTWFERDDIWYMPTFHPAALLRDPRRKPEVWEDIQKVYQKYRQLVDPNHSSPFIGK